MEAEGLPRKVDVAQLLLEAARQLGETLEPERVYERFHLLLADVVPHDGIVVSSYDEAESLIRCEYAWVEGSLLDPATLPPLPLNREGGGMQSRVIVTGEPLLANDVVQRTAETGGTYYNVDREGQVRKIPDLGPADTTAAMMAPVKHEAHVVGVVQLMRDGGQYTDDDFQLFQGLVGQMAAAVRNARLQQERRRLAAAEAAARARADEREQAARVLDVVGDGIFLVDQDGVVALWNRAATAITGIDGAAAYGRAITDVVPDWGLLAERISVTDETASAPQTLPVNLNGRQLWLSFVAVRSPDGVVFTFRDLTGERRLDDEKRDLVATISHELRTPMAAVYGAAQTLLRTDVDLGADQARELLEMIATQALRLTQITEEVLLTARLDRGTVHLERELIDLADLARATIAALKPQLPPDCPVSFDVEPDLPPARGDRDRVQQVLVNLLDNAAKYGRPPLAVSLEARTSVVCLAVADSGPGIPHIEQERIFDKFYRGDPQLTHAPGGTGLGLYIARELTERMGGRLDVRSEPDAGAKFIIELPRG
ncbi:MAG TPA: ATP-binding protein [Gaiellaceae bacterium]|nr:ATP-binding protein [Gaiellaceae bacterium]